MTSETRTVDNEEVTDEEISPLAGLIEKVIDCLPPKVIIERLRERLGDQKLQDLIESLRPPSPEP